MPNDLRTWFPKLDARNPSHNQSGGSRLQLRGVGDLRFDPVVGSRVRVLA